MVCKGRSVKNIANGVFRDKMTLTVKIQMDCLVFWNRISEILFDEAKKGILKTWKEAPGPLTDRSFQSMC
jgi:hypothetical protein